MESNKELKKQYNKAMDIYQSNKSKKNIDTVVFYYNALLKRAEAINYNCPSIQNLI